MSLQYPKGSEWRKWDLHVHSPLSSLNNQYPKKSNGAPDWDSFIDKLKTISDVSVLGITDYFFIDGYKKVMEFKKQGRLANFDLILPNVELRLDTLVVKKKSKDINFHVIFSPQLEVDVIENEFIKALDVELSGSVNGLTGPRKLNKRTVQEIGALVKKNNKTSQNDSVEKAAFQNITVSLKQVRELLRKDLFKGKFIFVLSGHEWDDIDWKQAYLTKKNFLQTAHTLETGSLDTINWALGRKDLSREDFIEEFGCLKPCVFGSDAHCLDKICRPHDNKFCWVKADPTFEGLKQIVYEPELRVKIQEDNPSESETYAKINSLAINFPEQLKIKDESNEKTDFCLNGKYSLDFSNNLTCIIGGRGSGKSTLAHIVYNSWINHDSNKLNSVNSPLMNLELRPSPLKQVSEHTTCEVPAQTEFFFQNEIEYSAKNIESMSILIGNRLNRLSTLDGGDGLDDLKTKWDTSLARIDELIDAYDRIVETDDDILKATENINTLRKQTAIIKSEEYKAFQMRIGELTTKIADFKSYKTDYDELVKEIESLFATVARLNWTDDQGKASLDALLTNLKDRKEELHATFTKFYNDYREQDYHGQLNKSKQELGGYLKARGLSPENVHELAEANTKIKEFEEQIRLARLEKTPYDELYAKKNKTVEASRQAYKKYKTRFLDVSSSLQEKLAGLSISDKEITFSLDVEHSQLKNGLVGFVKNNLEDDATLRSDILERLLFGDEEIDKYIKDKSKIRTHLNRATKAEKHRQTIQELFNNDVFLEKYHLRLLKYYYSIDNIHVQTKLAGKLLKNTSFGERCGIVIAIILVAGTNPIVIDQPEDHLDGKFISLVLVPLLKQQKHNRQIILITRDANVVVGGDAELIHILEPTDARTEILPSSIEDIDCRERYIWVLDGGTDAFAQREQKYDIGLLKAHR